MSFTLYEISKDYQKVLNVMLEGDELEPSTGIEVFDKINDDIEQKAISIAGYIKNLEAESEVVRTAAKEMLDRATKLDNKVESLSNYLKYHLENCGIQEIKKVRIL